MVVVKEKAKEKEIRTKEKAREKVIRTKEKEKERKEKMAKEAASQKTAHGLLPQTHTREAGGKTKQKENPKEKISLRAKEQKEKMTKEKEKAKEIKEKEKTIKAKERAQKGRIKEETLITQALPTGRPGVSISLRRRTRQEIEKETKPKAKEKERKAEKKEKEVPSGGVSLTGKREDRRPVDPKRHSGQAGQARRQEKLVENQTIKRERLLIWENPLSIRQQTPSRIRDLG